MTSEQKKQVTDALVAFVLRVTSRPDLMEQPEASALPAALDFLMKTDSSDVLSYIPIEPSSDLYKGTSKNLLKSKWKGDIIKV